MTVICNATPLINFAAINRLDILKEVFGQVIIPQAVYDETTVSGFLWSQFILQAIASGWLQVRTVSNIDPIISPELDDGEREAIALALETDVHKILLDERDARKVAQSIGLRLVGTLGILLLAKEKHIIRKISELDETPEAIRKFKEDLKSNYQKFFSESFKNQGFQSKWEELEKIRHKVAHNNLFTNSDLEKGRQLYDELIDIIKTATQKVDQITLDSEEREAIRESFVDRGILTDITEFEFLEELRQQELYYSNLNNGFVGLANFVKIHLNGKGYNMTSTYGLIEELAEQGKIEVYHVDNPYSENKTAAIKGLPGQELLRFAGSIPKKDLQLMSEA